MVVVRVEFHLGRETPPSLIQPLKRKEENEEVREVGGDVETTGLYSPGAIIVPYMYELV